MKPNVASAEAALEPISSKSSPHHQRRLLQSMVAGAGALGLALGIERGGGFISNVLAARWAGAHIFGTYSIAIATAYNVAWYSGAGIGQTASRFAAEHAPGTPAYRQIVRSLLIIASLCAAVAAVVLFGAAGPMARIFFRNPQLTRPLQFAALSAAAFVLLECCRGLFIGTRLFGRLLVMATVVGIGLAVVVPMGATLGASSMLARQSGVVLLGVLLGVILIRTRHEAQPQPETRQSPAPGLSRVWKFGLLQLSGVAGLNAAGWWTASLVARWDVSLLQVAFYVVATQLRNISSLIPSLIQSSNFAFFTDEGARDFGGADHVVSVSSFASSVLATICSGIAVVSLPWILRHFYGKGYGTAEFPSVLAIATLLVQFGVAPAASRLLILSPLSAGVVNGIMAVVIVVLATIFIPLAGAIAATATLLFAHVLAMFLVLVSLWRLDALPASVTMLAVLDTATALATVWLGWARTLHPQYTTVCSLTLLVITGAVTLLLLRWGQHRGVFPKPLSLASILQLNPAKLRFS